MSAHVDLINAVLDHASPAEQFVTSLVALSRLPLQHQSPELILLNLFLGFFKFLLLPHFIVMLIKRNTAVNDPFDLRIDTFNFVKELVSLLLGWHIHLLLSFFDLVVDPGLQLFLVDLWELEFFRLIRVLVLHKALNTLK